MKNSDGINGSKAACGVYSAPGKIFLLGEYAVLAGLPGIIATLGPRFQLQVTKKAIEQRPRFVPHPQSPAGRFLSTKMGMELSKFSLDFEDPLQGAGGFGASTAQFVMLYHAYLNDAGERDRSWTKLWKLYRELMKDEALIPSGADLIAQSEGSIVLVDPAQGKCTSLWSRLDWSSLLIFSATDQKGRKVATHEHLALLSQTGFPDPESAQKSELAKSLAKLMKQGVDAVQKQDHAHLGRVMDSYADTLRLAHLELAATHEDRQALRSLPHVLGVKGAGALQADAILVLMKPHSENRQDVVTLAQARGLRLVSDGVPDESGVQFTGNFIGLSKNH